MVFIFSMVGWDICVAVFLLFIVKDCKCSFKWDSNDRVVCSVQNNPFYDKKLKSNPSFLFLKIDYLIALLCKGERRKLSEFKTFPDKKHKTSLMWFRCQYEMPLNKLKDTSIFIFKFHLLGSRADLFSNRKA